MPKMFSRQGLELDGLQILSNLNYSVILIQMTCMHTQQSARQTGEQKAGKIPLVTEVKICDRELTSKI